MIAKFRNSSRSIGNHIDSKHMKSVIGMGNALVDVLLQMDNDDLLDAFKLPKGSMQLVDKDLAQQIMHAVQHLPIEVASGGSAANTIHGLANLGLSTGYIGKIQADQYGEIFKKDMTAIGIDAYLMAGSQDTGIATTLISPDSQRTFATYLGAAVELEPTELSRKLFKGYDFLHIEGYLVQNHALIETAVRLARESGLKVSIDLASYNVVEDNLDFLKELVSRYVDIVFANEEESHAFTGGDPQEALEMLSTMCEIAVVKVGAKGSMVKSRGETIFSEAIQAAPLDTTGAGDLYAAGFLFGLCKGQPLLQCAKLGALLAGNVIEVVGPKMDAKRWNQIKMGVSELLS